MDEIRRKRKEKIEEACLRNWSSLPDDILSKIFRKLFFKDTLCVAAVCKGWKIPIPKPSSFPWLMANRCSPVSPTGQNQLLSEFLFHEPYNPEPYRFKKLINFPAKEEGTKFVHPHEHVLDSKFGWLLGLLWCKLESTKEPVEYYSLFLYCPFANKCSSKILPPLYLPYKYDQLVTTATFSSHPTSLQCVVFLVLSSYNGKTEIHKWRNGQDTWNKHLVNCDESFICSMVYIDGFLYCLHYSGSLGIFNSSDGVWKITSPFFGGDETRWHYLQLLAESNGELLLVCVTRDTNYYVYRYDISKNAWIRKLRLDDQVMFLDFGIRRAFLVSVSASEEGMQMANRVYEHPFGGKVRYFPLEADEWHQDDELFVVSYFPSEYDEAWFTLPF